MDGEHLFLSYRRASPDKEFAARLAADLRASGHRVWMDVFGIEGGSTWNAEIQQALDTCYGYVLVLSPDALASRWVRNELLYALQEKPGRVYPVMFRPCKLPIELVSVQYVNFVQSYDAAFPNLIAALPRSPDQTVDAVSMHNISTRPSVRLPAAAPPPQPASRPAASPAEPKPPFLRRWHRAPVIVLSGVLAIAMAAVEAPGLIVLASIPAGLIGLGHLRRGRFARGMVFMLLAALWAAVGMIVIVVGTDGYFGVLLWVISLMIVAPVAVIWSFLDSARGKSV
jgi:hypothetical protein